MSEFLSMVCDSDLRVVLPYAGRLEFMPIFNGADTVLCFTVRVGYFETSSLDVCILLRAYIGDAPNSALSCVGSIDEVVLSGSDESVYRQRFKCQDLSLLFRLVKRFESQIVISKDFQIGVSQLLPCLNAVPFLNSYIKHYKHTVSVEDWLTGSCVLYLTEYAKHLGVSLVSEVSVRHGLLRGIFNRSPYLCVRFSTKSKGESSILLLPSERLTYSSGGHSVLLAKPDGYQVKQKRGIINLYGYSSKNILSDKQKGII